MTVAKNYVARWVHESLVVATFRVAQHLYVHDNTCGQASTDACWSLLVATSHMSMLLMCSTWLKPLRVSVGRCWWPHCVWYGYHGCLPANDEVNSCVSTSLCNGHWPRNTCGHLLCGHACACQPCSSARHSYLPVTFGDHILCDRVFFCISKALVVATSCAALSTVTCVTVCHHRWTRTVQPCLMM